MTETLETLETIAKPELSDEEKFIDAIRHLRSYQHQIDDIADQAAIEINKARNRYNYWLAQYEPFLREYALAHAKIDKHGEKSKHFKCIAAGGGVYFRSIPRSINFSEEAIEQLDKMGCAPELITKKVVYVIKDAEQLLKLVHEKALPLTYEIEEGDPIGKMYVGSSKAWTVNPAKRRISKALHGRFEEEGEE